MILDALKGDTGWFVWDAEACCVPSGVVWVDDERARWGQRDHSKIFSALVFGEDGMIVERQAKRIVIYQDRKLIIFNPVADESDDAITLVVGKPEEVSA